MTFDIKQFHVRFELNIYHFAYQVNIPKYSKIALKTTHLLELMAILQ